MWIISKYVMCDVYTVRLQAANRQRAVNLKNQREKSKTLKSNDLFSPSVSDEKKKKSKRHKSDNDKKDKSKTKHKTAKIEKIKPSTKNKTEIVTENKQKTNLKSTAKNVKVSYMSSNQYIYDIYRIIITL